MSKYGMFLLGGSSMVAFAVLVLFSAGAHDKQLRKSMVFFLLGAGLLYLADKNSSGGLVPGDLPGIILKMVKMFSDECAHKHCFPLALRVA